MALRGTQAKAEILTKLQEIYPSAFLIDKVLRIPMIEDGQTVEIFGQSLNILLKHF